MLMSDQHSKRQVGCYGDDLVRTPNMDRLAAEGMLFENAYTPSPLCVPARSSFMTARRPTANRVWNNNHVLGSDIPTWAHVMGAGGYETALIGRMHFVGPDQRHGFERRPIGEFLALHPGADIPGAPLFDLIPKATSDQHRTSVEMAGVGKTNYQVSDEMVESSLIEYLREKAQGGDGRPFAAVAGILNPHCPFIAPKELFDYYYERVDVPQPTPDELEREPGPIKRFKQLRNIDRPLTEHQVRVARAAYYGMCELVDRLLGNVLQVLEDTGLSENTLVVYTTDHGESAGEHGCWWKANYYEESVGVPLIARLPGVVPSGVRNPVICNTIDLGPTIIEMAGLDPLHEVDGHSLWTELRGQNDERRPNETFSELMSPQERVPTRMIRRGPWKLYRYVDGSAPVLFNLEEDPRELNDLGSNPSYENVRDDLLGRLLIGWDPRPGPT